MNWNFAYTPTIWPSVFTLLLLAALALYSGRRRSVPGAIPFMIGCLFAALWAAGSVMEIIALDLAAKIFWVKFQAACQLPIVTAITCFSLEYTWPGRRLTRRNLALLSFPPLLALGLILTNDLHHLAWRGFVYAGSVFPVWGLGNYFFYAYYCGLAIVNFIVFAWLYLRSPQHRWPVVIILIGMIGGQAVYLLDKTPIYRSNLHLDILGMAFTYLTFSIALFGFRLFDPIPLARQTAIEQMYAGMLVLDPQGRVTNLNPAAERILSISANRAKGQLIRELLPVYPNGQAVPDGMEIEFSPGAGAEIRHYALAISLLKDWRGLELGRLLLLRDVTEQKQAHDQMVEQQRALAMLHERERMSRELHDSLGQVFAFVNAQGEAIRLMLSRGDHVTADKYASRLVDVAREADVDIRELILGLRVTLSGQGFFATLVEYLDQYEETYGIHPELDKPESMVDEVFEPLIEVQLLRILQEALTNVRKHAGAQRVRITFSLEDGWAHVTVQDDGQGFDPETRPEGLRVHVGLRVMRERAEEVGGSLQVESTPGGGTRVVIKVPAN